MNKYQNTISKSVEFSGIGLHSGEKSKVILIPASVDTGIIFKVNNSSIQASWSNAIISQLCTKIKKNISISTIEHLMAAISGLGISNLIIKINSNEVPILDGSSKEFVDQIKIAGISKQKISKSYQNFK